MPHSAPRHCRLARPLFAALPLAAIALLSVSFAEPPEPPPGPSDGAPRVEPDGPPPPPPRPGRGDFRGSQSPRGERPPFERGQFGGQRPRPSPERFVERAMRYDDDKDGKLDREELTKFAEDLMDRFGPGGDEPPPPPRDRVERGESREGGKRPLDGERPERPRRPDGEDFPERPRRPLDDRPAPPPADPDAE